MFKDPKINSRNPPKINFVDLFPIPILTLAMSSVSIVVFVPFRLALLNKVLAKKVVAKKVVNGGQRHFARTRIQIV